MARPKRKLLGAPPQQIDRELRALSRPAKVLSNRPRFVERREWVGIHKGEVSATAKSFKALVTKLKRRGLSPDNTTIQHVDTTDRLVIF